MKRDKAGMILEPLTQRELQILRLIAEGLSNREIGQRLTISIETVKWYNKRLFTKLEVGSRTAAVAQGRECGLLSQANGPVAPDAVQADRLRRHNLPAPPTPLVGREQEVRDVERLLRREDVRLVTLTGPGGMGKTRLAIEVAHSLLPYYPDGVFLVSLAPLQEPSLLAATIADELRVQERGGTSILETLKEALAERELALLLDNFEHLVESASLVAELLVAAPRLNVLVTSRERLRLRGEFQYPVGPLATPSADELDAGLATKDVAAFPAVELFRQRAAASRPAFEVTADNAATVATICSRLDGLPLAIELAAARLPLFSTPQGLLARLGSGLTLLKGGARDLPARQQTLRGTIEWSYKLLAPEERKLFRRLAVFVGGWTLQAAEAVCRANGGLGIDVLDGLEALLDKNLLRREEGVANEPRFAMLQMIHDFAREHLEAGGEADAVRSHHAHYFLALAEEAEPELRRRTQGYWLERLEREQNNLRAALEWGQQAKRWELVARIAGALSRFWIVRSSASEGRRWVESVLTEAQNDVDVKLEARLLHAAGSLAWQQGDYRAAQVYLLEGLETARRTGNHEQSMRALGSLGNVAANQGDYASARSYYEQSQAIAEEFGDTHAIGWVVGNLGNLAVNEGEYASARSFVERSMLLAGATGDGQVIAWGLGNLGTIAASQGDYVSANRYYQESLAIAEEIGDKRQLTKTLNNLGALATDHADAASARGYLERSLAIAEEIGHKRQISGTLDSLGDLALREGNLAQARSYLERSMAVAKEIGDRQVIAVILCTLGIAADREGDPVAARSYYEQSLALAEELGKGWQIVRTLGNLAALEADSGHANRASRIWGAVQRLRDETGVAIPAVDLVRYERSLAAARRQLGEERFSVATAEGRAMNLTEAISLALEPAAPDERQAKLPSKKDGLEHPAGLTPREADVLRLVARGMTDAEVAEELTISSRTVNAHLTSIYRKLDVNSRMAAALLAAEHGLV